MDDSSSIDGWLLPGTSDSQGELLAMEEALFRATTHLQVTLDSIGDAVITTDADGLIDTMNPVAEDLTGWSQSEAKGLPLLQVFQVVEAACPLPQDLTPYDDMNRNPTYGAVHHSLLLCQDGREFAIQETLSPILDREGRVSGAVLVFHDISQTQELTQQLSFQASHDLLTRLPNRSEFERRLERALRSACTDGVRHALCYLDLDQFKIINDMCGHVAGDEMLVQITTLLQSQIRSADTLARLGGDEFGILLSNCPTDKARQIAENLRQSIQNFRFEWNGESYSIGVSIGLVGIDQESPGLRELLSAADTSCFAAKDRGRNHVQVYQPDDIELTRHQGEMQWVQRISRALEEDRFCLYYQSITPVADRMAEGDHFEILLRMVDETGQLVPPMTFIPAAERYNLMPAIDRWVISTAFALLSGSSTRRQCPAGLCAINLSGASLTSDSLLDFILAQFALHSVKPESICFEITETAAIGNSIKAIQFMTKLKQQGCRFALDDFGSGLSSFAYLKTLPVDYLKIDGTFVKDIVNDPIHCAMVESIHHIGHLMGIKTIAEFVESDTIMQKLRSIGVDYAQGYAVARPQPLL
jgi:diguanylate cyclase (GGDEF)-like protein/PAS domain S-box-containing protein